jgi:Raf kinase inhibitor-like YbhB/YbcL family protein
MRRLLAAALLLGLAACSRGGGRGPARERDLPQTLTVSSRAFAAGAAIPARYTCAGRDTSPPLAWSRPPAGTAELALVVDDPDAPGGTFVHWVVAHLDPAAGGLAEGAVPRGALQLPGSSGKAAWTGPCPPAGPAHHYRFTVYALARRVQVAAGAKPADSVAAIEAAATARGRLVATFGR